MLGLKKEKEFQNYGLQTLPLARAALPLSLLLRPSESHGSEEAEASGSRLRGTLSSPGRQGGSDKKNFAEAPSVVRVQVYLPPTAFVGTLFFHV